MVRARSVVLVVAFVLCAVSCAGSSNRPAPDSVGAENGRSSPRPSGSVFVAPRLGSTLVVREDELCGLRAAAGWCSGAYISSFESGYGYSFRPPTRLPFSGAVVALSAGGAQGCALLATGSVECWGANTHGQFGSPVSGEVHVTPRAVGGTRAARQVVVAGEMTFIVDDAGVVHVLGGCDLDDHATTSCPPTVLELADGRDFRNPRHLAAGIVVSESGELFLNGWPESEGYRAGGSPPSASHEMLRPRDGAGRGGLYFAQQHDVRSVHQAYRVGADGACVLLVDGRVLCRGGNGFGQVGVPVAPWETETYLERSEDPAYFEPHYREPVGLGPSDRLWCSRHLCCAEGRDTREIKCWGWNLDRVVPNGPAIVLPTRMPFSAVGSLAIGRSFICYDEREGERATYCTGVPPMSDHDIPADDSRLLPRRAPERLELP